MYLNAVFSSCQGFLFTSGERSEWGRKSYDINVNILFLIYAKKANVMNFMTLAFQRLKQKKGCAITDTASKN